MISEALRTLKIMAKGGRIEARRTFPHPPHYWLVKPDGNRYAAGLAVSTMDALVTGGLIEPGPPLNWRHDSFDYAITPAGEVAAKGKPSKPIYEQLAIPGTETV